jgi:hypothetical protein
MGTIYFVPVTITLNHFLLSLELLLYCYIAKNLSMRPAKSVR